MIHFFPELSALYHRCLLVSLTKESQPGFFDGWTEQFWKLVSDQNQFVTIPITESSVDETSHVKGWAAGSLGRRNSDDQRLISASVTLPDLLSQPRLAELGDSLFIEVDWSAEMSTELVRWQGAQMLTGKKVIWCLKDSFSASPNLHHMALDKKMKSLAPESLRILWKDEGFMRDALEWVLSF